MEKNKKTIVLIIVFFALILSSMFLYDFLTERYVLEDNPTASTSTNQDYRMAANFSVEDVNGNMVALHDFIGQPTVLGFFTTWCVTCKEQMHYFESAYLSMGQDVNFMMINLVDGQSETVEGTKMYIESNNYTLPVYFDVNFEAILAHRVFVVPTTIFINADGYIVHTQIGPINEEGIKTFVEYAM